MTVPRYANPSGRRAGHWRVAWIGSALALAACSSGVVASKAAPPAPTTTISIARQSVIGEWEATNQGAVSNLLADASTVLAAVGGCAKMSPDSCAARIGPACFSLGASAQTDQSLPAIADSEGEHEWATALDEFVSGAAKCTAAARARDDGQIRVGARGIASGATMLTALQHLVEHY